MKRAILIVAVSVLAITNILLADTLEQPIFYWADEGSGTIKRSTIDGSSTEIVISGINRPNGLAVDTTGGKIYWGARGSSTILRANLDGTCIENLVSINKFEPVDITLDLNNNKMYWTDIRYGKIQRANLDGSQIEDIAAFGGMAAGIDIDLQNEKLYWTDPFGSPLPGKVWSSNLDGSEAVNIFTESVNFYDITLDVNSENFYWAEGGWIKRANYDGTNIENIISISSGAVLGLDIDPISNKLYWTNALTNSIHRSNLDGSGIENIITNASRPLDIEFVVPEPASLILFSLCGLMLRRRR